MDQPDLLPSCRNSEAALLSSFLHSPQKVHDLCQSRNVVEEWFLQQDHATLYKWFLRYYQEKRPFELIALTSWFESHYKEIGLLTPNIGALMTEIYSKVPTGSNAEYYLGILQEKYALRMGILGARNAIKEFGSSMSLQETFDIASKSMVKCQEACAEVAAVNRKNEAIMEFMEEIEQASKGIHRYIPTPFKTINQKVGGFGVSEMIVISGPKSSGKSLVSMQCLCDAVFEHGKAGAVFSMEMPVRQYVRRMTSRMGRISLNRMQHGVLNEGEVRRFSSTLTRINSAPLEFYDFANCKMTMGDIESKIRQQHKNIGCQFAVLDYLQLIKTVAKSDKRRDQELSEVTIRSKQLCNELGMNIIVLCAENYDGKIRESGGVEYDCDTRFQIKLDKQTEKPDHLWIDKMRDGEAKYRVPVHMDGDLCMFQEREEAVRVSAF